MHLDYQSFDCEFYICSLHSSIHRFFQCIFTSSPKQSRGRELKLHSSIHRFFQCILPENLTQIENLYWEVALFYSSIFPMHLLREAPNGAKTKMSLHSSIHRFFQCIFLKFNVMSKNSVSVALFYSSIFPMHPICF